MKAKVTYKSGKAPECIDLYSHGDHVGHAKIRDGDAIITKMMPHDGDDTVTGEMCDEALWVCENLDCVERADFGGLNV